MQTWIQDKKPIIAMLHVPALPGTPKARLSVEELIEQTCREAQQYLQCGVDALAVENMHDIPYVRGPFGPEIVSYMTTIAVAVRALTSRPIGIQILAAGGQEALAVAAAARLDFVRVEGFVFAHVADEGLLQSCAGQLLRYRKWIGAERIAVFADIKKKHCSHAITHDVDIVQTAQAADFFLADGVIITGQSTGCAADIQQVRCVKRACSLPVLVGSGVTVDNVDQYLAHADALIVGSHFKQHGRWNNPVESDRVQRFMDRVNELRNRR